MAGSDTVTLSALDPALRAALGPKPVRATKEGGASSLAIQPHRGSPVGRQRQAGPHIRSHLAPEPSQEASPAL